MKATDQLFVPQDVTISPVESLVSHVRERLDCEKGDWVISRHLSRARSIVIDASAAALLAYFRRPTSVVDAILLYAEANGEDPEKILDQIGPLLLLMRQRQFLVVDIDYRETQVKPLLSPGDIETGFEVMGCVHLFDNVEIYQARSRSGEEVALKILGSAPTTDAVRMMEREAVILAYLDGTPAPLFVGEGSIKERRFLVQKWCEGVNALRAAGVRRRGKAAFSGSELIEICVNILRAYVKLHERGVVHGDVHPGNVLISEKGDVTLLDFGLSICEACDRHLPPPRRGGVFNYFEPEYCLGLMRQKAPPPATFMSDQFALGSMFYSMIADAPYQHFSLNMEAWIAQVPNRQPLAFSEHGLEPWPEMEAILKRAMETDPCRRFVSTVEFLKEFEGTARTQKAPRRLNRSELQLVERVITRFALGPTKLALTDIGAPYCSINHGAAGIAYFLYRIACLRDDARLLATADYWCTMGRQHSKRQEAFENNDLGITKGVTGLASLFHRESGLFLVQALISQAMGDSETADCAISEFVESSGNCNNPDLTFGYGSVLLGCANLLAALPPDCRKLPDILTLGRRTALVLTHFLQAHEMSDGVQVRWLGMAHGWAGFLYALLRWKQASGDELPMVAHRRLDELTELGSSDGRSISWPVGVGPDTRNRPAFIGWCHGSAGYVLLWTLAYAVLRERKFFTLARGALDHLDEASLRNERRGNASLCCGFAGQAFASLSIYRHSRGVVDLQLAERLCDLALEHVSELEPRDSLYHGEVGVALLVEELKSPLNSTMPILEAER